MMLDFVEEFLIYLVILEYEIPFLKVNGRFLPQKMIGTDEIENSSNALKVFKF